MSSLNSDYYNNLPTSFTLSTGQAAASSFAYSASQEFKTTSIVGSGRNCSGFLPSLPLEQYKLNEDPNPEVIRKRPAEKVRYVQEVQYRFLEPPAAPRPGDLVVKQLPNRQVAPAPPLVVRQAPPKPANPAPLVLREAPPQPPSKVSELVVNVPGKVLAPPARKVVVERLPAIPQKPQQVLLEKWLGYKQQKRRVVFQPAEQDCVLPNPRNLVIQWENPEVEVTRQIKNLGTQQADPAEYVRKHGSSLLRHDEFLAAARKSGAPDNVVNVESHREYGLPEFEGDLQALRLVDLDRAGLAEYRSYLSSLGISFDAARFQSSELGLVTTAENSGLVSFEQAQATANNLNAGAERPVSESELKVYFNSIDTNGDGVVSFQEFKDAVL